MADLLKGAAVAEAIRNRNIKDIDLLKEKGIVPTLAVVRVGESPDDIAYEKSIEKACEKVGVGLNKVELKENISWDEFEKEVQGLNDNDLVHGILMFMPLPKQLDGEKARAILKFEKDVDGLTDDSLAGVFINKKKGFPPCTAEAVMETLDFYGINPEGKKVAVIGRSLVIGRPVAMMLMHRNATVVNCHTKTKDIPSITKSSDIIVTAAGRLNSLTSQYVSKGQVVLDVGINWDEEKGNISGDASFDEVEPIVKAITPVPGGIGTVTTALLVSHVVDAAKASLNN